MKATELFIEEAKNRAMEKYKDWKENQMILCGPNYTLNSILKITLEHSNIVYEPEIIVRSDPKQLQAHPYR